MKRAILSAKQAAYTDQDVLDVIKYGFDALRKQYKLKQNELVLDDVEIEPDTRGTDRITISFTLYGYSRATTQYQKRSKPVDNTIYSGVAKSVAYNVKKRHERAEEDKQSKRMDSWMNKLQNYVDAYCSKYGQFNVALSKYNVLYPNIYFKVQSTPEGRQNVADSGDSRTQVSESIYGNEYVLDIYGMYSIKSKTYKDAVQDSREVLQKLLVLSTNADTILDGLPDGIELIDNLVDDISASLPDVDVHHKMWYDSYCNSVDIGVEIQLKQDGQYIGNSLEIEDIFSVNTSDIIKKLKAKVRRYQPQPSKRSLMK